MKKEVIKHTEVNAFHDRSSSALIVETSQGRFVAIYMVSGTRCCYLCWYFFRRPTQKHTQPPLMDRHGDWSGRRAIQAVRYTTRYVGRRGIWHSIMHGGWYHRSRKASDDSNCHSRHRGWPRISLGEFRLLYDSTDIIIRKRMPLLRRFIQNVVHRLFMSIYN